MEPGGHVMCSSAVAGADYLGGVVSRALAVPRVTVYSPKGTRARQ